MPAMANNSNCQSSCTEAVRKWNESQTGRKEPLAMQHKTETELCIAQYLTRYKNLGGTRVCHIKLAHNSLEAFANFRASSYSRRAKTVPTKTYLHSRTEF
eukprot:4120991-Amphidinium_carterae.1